MNARMSSDVNIPSNLLGMVIAGLIGVVTTVLGIMASRRKEKAEASSKVVDSSVALLEKYEISVDRLHTRIDVLEKRDVENRDLIHTLSNNLDRNERELEKTKLKLGHAEEMLDMALEWMNEYTPALKEAGIEPLDADDLKFRGEEPSTGDET